MRHLLPALRAVLILASGCAESALGDDAGDTFRDGGRDARRDGSVDSSMDAPRDSDDGGDDAGHTELDGGTTDAGVEVGAPDAGPPTVERTSKVWVWNVAGQLIHRGSTGTGLIEVAVASIRNRDADFAGFNELCFQQYRALQRGLRAAGWPEDADNFSRFSETRAPTPSVCAGERFGNALFSRRPLGRADDITLPTDGSREHRSMLCAPLSALPHLRFCTTHISTSSEVGDDGLANNIRQLMAVQDQLGMYHRAGDTVIIAGDFNAQPHYARLNRFYSATLDTRVNGDNRGAYRELDDADPAHCAGYGERTTQSESADPCGATGGVKIDLIFVRESQIIGDYSGDSLAISDSCGGPCSDHRILIGTVTTRVRE